MLFLSAQLGNSIFTQFESDGAVCPTKLRSNAFTTFDHNSSSLSAKDSWHETAISLTLHLDQRQMG